MKECIYCNKDLSFTNHGYYPVREAIHSPSTHNRWVTVGYCCKSCRLANKPLAKDIWKE